MFMIIGLVVFLLYLNFFVGFNQIFVVIENLNAGEFAILYSLAVGAMLLVMFFWAVSWRTLLGCYSNKVSLKNAFFYYWAGYFSDLVIPGQGVCGEATRMYLVRKDTKDNYGAIAACGVTNRIIAYTVVTGGLTLGLVYLLTTPLFAQLPVYVPYILLVTWIGSVIHVGALLYLALSDAAVKKIASLIFKILRFFRLKKYTSEENMKKTYDSLARFHEGSRFFRRNPRALLTPFGLQILSYVLSMIVYALILSTMGVTSGFIPFFILIYFLAGAIQDASAVFSVGALEIILTSVFVGIYGSGFAASGGVAVAMLRTVTFWFPVVVGYIIIQAIGARSMMASRACAENAIVETKSTEPELGALRKPRDVSGK